MIVESDKNKNEDILTWYVREKANFTQDKRRVILNSWISICVEEEKYDLAFELKKELSILNAEEGIWGYIKRHVRKFWKKINR